MSIIILAKDLVADQIILLGTQSLTVTDTVYRKPGKGQATVVLDLLDVGTGMITQKTFLPEQPLTVLN